ncbi:putative CopG family antitoxin [Sphingobium sp. B2D3A]|uniref:hypothetical protein n=1 Tax=unclassified Sphingobium TaxID=2611147 RepID=UPI002224F5ED|nr:MULTISPECIES: hypothetical protein [unclassified Sphingobium]MCW2338912.1 putative CopG family antitoxin [Sphingobium sp. B2D3A]MCW2385337.1 putative CopG family antitoxin [Sphingobium sp. B2D3D]MCW2411299.1 putative CopG family antitoxin [Sphingobium sp. B8D3D]MCW2416409.1 putative CopG family antitoxin [Sphingobium sp. B8D3A]
MQIEIDFDVFKALTALRHNEADGYNDVLRRLLKLPNRENAVTNALLAGMSEAEVDALMRRPAGGNVLAPYMNGAWFNGVLFPNGTKLKADYKGRTYFAEIQNGQWLDSNGIVRTSPSDAAGAITGNNVNGWRFWHAKGPADANWRRLDEFQ